SWSCRRGRGCIARTLAARLGPGCRRRWSTRLERAGFVDGQRDQQIEILIESNHPRFGDPPDAAQLESVQARVLGELPEEWVRVELRAVEQNLGVRRRSGDLYRDRLGLCAGAAQLGAAQLSADARRGRGGLRGGRRAVGAAQQPA